jgi:hypothetical protein
MGFGAEARRGREEQYKVRILIGILFLGYFDKSGFESKLLNTWLKPGSRSRAKAR